MIVVPFTLGPLANNTYLAADPTTGEAVAVDPSFESEPLLTEVAGRGWKLAAVWLTHAHFDHIAGTNLLRDKLGERIPIGLHPADLPLWREHGGAGLFGFSFHAGEDPTLLLDHGLGLTVGNIPVEVRHTPGHSPGHVVFVVSSAGLVFSGDLIFYRSVGRTDLPGGSSVLLARSIREQIYTLPPETRLLPGHGPETTVGDELKDNPFV